MKIKITCIALLVVILACAPRKSMDKTVKSSLLGTGIGAGAGAIVGNQVGNLAKGAGIGAGLGLISGFSTGLALDSLDGRMVDQKRELQALRIKNISNGKKLAHLQRDLDSALSSNVFGGMYQVFFDVDATNLKSGSIANLENIADAIAKSPYAYTINIYGHTDDSSDPKYNERLAEARARKVASYMEARGININQVNVKSFGSKMPVASNTTETGRQLNRRVDIFISR